MEKQTVENYLAAMREKLDVYASSQTFFAWAGMALEFEGAEPNAVFYNVWKFNLKGATL